MCSEVWVGSSRRDPLLNIALELHAPETDAKAHALRWEKDHRTTGIALTEFV